MEGSMMEPQVKTVLLVDDDKFFRELFSDFLKGLGMQVTSLAEGRAGREWLTHHQPVLVCLDLTLPDDVSGYDLCDFIRKTPGLSGVPILMVSARDAVADRASAEDAGANAYLVKPTFKRLAEFERTFTQTVRQLLGEA